MNEWMNESKDKRIANVIEEEREKETRGSESDWRMKEKRKSERKLNQEGFKNNMKLKQANKPHSLIYFK